MQDKYYTSESRSGVLVFFFFIGLSGVRARAWETHFSTRHYRSLSRGRPNAG